MPEALACIPRRIPDRLQHGHDRFDKHPSRPIREPHDRYRQPHIRRNDLAGEVNREEGNVRPEHASQDIDIPVIRGIEHRKPQRDVVQQEPQPLVAVVANREQQHQPREAGMQRWHCRDRVRACVAPDGIRVERIESVRLNHREDIILREPKTRLDSGLWFPQNDVLAVIQPDGFNTLDTYSIWGNASPHPVAAMPSLHASFPWLVLLFAVRYYGYKGLWFLLYNVSLWFAVLYTANHWYIDVLAC